MGLGTAGGLLIREAHIKGICIKSGAWMVKRERDLIRGQRKGNISTPYVFILCGNKNREKEEEKKKEKLLANSC